MEAAARSRQQGEVGPIAIQEAVAERLRNAKFVPDTNAQGKPTRQRWRIGDPPVTVDFLIEPEESTEAQAGRLFDLTKDWAAIIAPGLHLAFMNNRMVALSDKTIMGEAARRDIRVWPGRGSSRPRPSALQNRPNSNFGPRSAGQACRGRAHSDWKERERHWIGWNRCV